MDVKHFKCDIEVYRSSEISALLIRQLLFCSVVVLVS